MYRFLLTPRWLGGLALAVAAAVAMVLLGVWQFHRYEERAGINNRIDAADSVQAEPLTSVLARPTVAGRAGPGGGNDISWTKVTISGRYDPSHEIQVRGRTVNGDIGFEIVTPLVLSDGTAVFIDRGWIPPAGDALAAPNVPPAPAGPVTVVGQVHLSESRPTAVLRRDGRLDTRRISVPRLAREMPYPVYGSYVLLIAQTPAADKAFEPIPIDHEDAWQNAGYTVQWWLFAAMALFAFGWVARKEAQGSPALAAAGAAPPGTVSPGTVSPAASADTTGAGTSGRPGSPTSAEPSLVSPSQPGAASTTQPGASPTTQPGPVSPAHSGAVSSDRPGAAEAPESLDRAQYPKRRPGAISRARAARKARPLDRVEESDQKAAARSARRPE